MSGKKSNDGGSGVDSDDSIVDVDDSADGGSGVDSDDSVVDVDSADSIVDVDSADSVVDVDSADSVVDVDSADSVVDVDDSADSVVDVDDSADSVVDVDSADSVVKVDDSADSVVNVGSAESIVDDEYQAIDDYDASETIQVAQDASIMSTDKTYRSKTNPIRAELYQLLANYLRLPEHSVQGLKKYFGQMKKEFQQGFDKAVDVTKLNISRKDLVKKKIAQELTKFVLTHQDESWVSCIICRLSFYNILKEASTLTWTAFELKNRENAEDYNNVTLKELTSKLKDVVRAEVEGFEEDVPDMLYFVEYGVDPNKEFGFIGIRREEIINTRKRSKTLITMTCFAFQLNSANLYANGRTIFPNLLAIVSKGLGFLSCSPRSLSCTNLYNVAQACTRRIHKPTVSELKRRMDEEIEEKNREGIPYFNPRIEKNRKLQYALLHDERDDPNKIEKFTLTNRVRILDADGNPDPTTNETVVTTTTVTVKGGNSDKYFAELHRQGFITDLAPFLLLKHKRANHLEIISDQNE